MARAACTNSGRRHRWVATRRDSDGGILIANLIAKGRKLAGIVSLGGIHSLRELRIGVAAAVEHARVLRNLGDVRTVADLGANRGQFALVARHCFPEARILSFEPLLGPAEKFKRVFASDPQVALHQAAIGPQAGETKIHISRRDDSSSLLPIMAMQDRLFPGTAEVGTELVRVGRLADFLSEVDLASPALLKLDVQGFELQALQGCEDLLDRFAWVYAECSFAELYAGQAFADAVITWLHERGFRMASVYNTSYDENGQAIQADFLFENMPDNRTNA